MKKDYSKFIYWKERIYGEIYRALRTNDKKNLRPAREKSKQVQGY